MKIVGFEANGALRLGVVEGDQVIDLQAVDSTIPGDLGECLRRNNGDLAPLKDAAKRAPAVARRALKGLSYGLPVAAPGKVICLGLNYLEHVKEGSQRDNIPKFPTIFMRGDARLRSRAHLHRRQTGQAPHACRRICVHRRICLRQRRLGARISTQDHAMGHGQEFRPHRWFRALDGHGRRSAPRRQGTEDREPAQRTGHAVGQHR
jgi:hypothetical protein